MAKKTLFVSFTSLVRLIRDKMVPQQDLDKGLYYFGCTKEYVCTNPLDRSEAVNMSHGPKDEDALMKIRTAVIKAVKERRAAFRTIDRFCNYTQLNALLYLNGVRFKPFSEEMPDGVASVIELASADMEVENAKDMHQLVKALNKSGYNTDYVRMLFGHAVNIVS